MTYTIYADDTLFLNTVINYFLLMASLLLSRIPLRRLRILLAAFLASLYALLALLPALSPFYIWPLRFLSALIFVLISTGFCKRALRAGVLFIFLSLLFGGMVSALTWLTHASSILTISRGVYLPGTLRVAAVISALLYYVILRFFKLLLPPKGSTIRHITLVHGEQECPLSLLLDTGSQLYDPIRNTPIPVVAKESLKHYFTREEYTLITTAHPTEVVARLFDSPHRFGLLPVTTAGGSQLLLTFRTRFRTEKDASSPTLVAISEGSIPSAEGFDGVIGL